MLPSGQGAEKRIATRAQRHAETVGINGKEEPLGTPAATVSPEPQEVHFGQPPDDVGVNSTSGATRHDADRDLERRITCFLYGRNLPALRRLETEVCNGVAIVEGQVWSYYEKQLVTCCCQRVAGVLQVVNRVRVSGPDDDSSASQDSSGNV